MRYFDAWLEQGKHGESPAGDSSSSSGSSKESDENQEENDEDEEDAQEVEEDESDEESSNGAGHFFGLASRGSRARTNSDSLPGSSVKSSALPPASPGKATDLSSSAPAYHTLYIQMELCHEKTLRDAIEANYFQGDPAIMAVILRQLLSVVAHVHRQGLVHRDLKPANVLFDQSSRSYHGDIKVADFGLARQMDMQMESESNNSGAEPPQRKGATASSSHPALTTGCGTMLYCAPEVLIGGDYDSRVDEYSIGVIAFEMWVSASGRDFRERYHELEVLESHGLPKWFKESHPQIGEILEKLFAARSRKESDLPRDPRHGGASGEPAEVSNALAVIERHADRVAERIVRQWKRVQQLKAAKDAYPPTKPFAVLPASQIFDRHTRLHNACMITLRQAVRVCDAAVDICREDEWLFDESAKPFVSPKYPHLPMAVELASSSLTPHDSHTYRAAAQYSSLSLQQAFGMFCAVSTAPRGWSLDTEVLLFVLGMLADTLPPACCFEAGARYHSDYQQPCVLAAHSSAPAQGA